MKTKQVKRPRPNLQSAHDYHREGSYSIHPAKHFTFEEERSEEIERIAKELREIGKKFPRTQNVEYALLKAHLIIEYAITQYIRGYATVAVTDKDIRLSFSQKLEVAYLLGFGANDPILLPTVEGINRLRNQIAHTFELDRVRLDEVFRINSEDYENFSIKDDRERVTHLRWIARYICAIIPGTMLGEYASMKYHERKVRSATSEFGLSPLTDLE
ncbi:hypothetical protein [Tabrizicola sp.]|uniref:hypothetical protein n=1 Tax=Tabrizicola sp. TaxID=2005166 RepID=UPI0035B35DF1